MIIRFEREDWKLFRNIETLGIKAGVSRDDIIKVVIKELVDNALDADFKCEIGKIGDNGFFVQDDGEGIPIEELGNLFSVNRSLVSSKFLRLPSRGALGNGLRVVSGSVLSYGGYLAVETKGKRFSIEIDERTGAAEVKEIGNAKKAGTRIEVEYLNKRIEDDDFIWGIDAVNFNHGTIYKGKTSPFWYTSESFFELVNAFDGSVRELVTLFDGWTGAKAAKIAGNYKNLKGNELTVQQAAYILRKLRESKSSFNPERLGKIGVLEGYNGYHKTIGYYKIQSAQGQNAMIPYVIEVLSKISECSSVKALVNKTPITDDMYIFHSKGEMRIYGANLSYSFKCPSAEIVINISTPYMIITTDGKKPDFSIIKNELIETIKKSVSKAKRHAPAAGIKKSNIKDIVFSKMKTAINKTSGNGQYRFSQRQLFYALRPYVLNELDKEPDYNYFCQLITEYEKEKGDINLMYRDVRGVLYEPHTRKEIPLGTLEVEQYERPEFTFNKVLYSEKEGFFTILKSIKFPEKHDLALLTSKGYASRAAKDLIDMLGETEEEILFFCIHDADAAGTKIFESLQEATQARPERKVKIINLGLEPAEALSMGLEIESVSGQGRKPVGNYLDSYWKMWLQRNRVELNAMSTPLFVEWLEKKLCDYGNGKIIPPEHVLIEQLKSNVTQRAKEQVREWILQQANYEEQVIEACNKIVPTIHQEVDLKSKVMHELVKNPIIRWDRPLWDLANKFKI